MKTFGYARCSTNEDKQDIERQARELFAMGAVDVQREYISGAKERPMLAALLDKLGEGDTLAATEVSRLTRSLHHLCHIVDTAREKRIRLACGSLVLDFTGQRHDPVMLAMLYVMGVFAEFERSMTVDRIKSGLENAKSKGVKMGRPRKTADDVPEAVAALLPQFRAGKFTKAEFAKRAGISRPSLYKYLRLLEEL